jgi:hypothetical protein
MRQKRRYPVGLGSTSKPRETSCTSVQFPAGRSGFTDIYITSRWRHLRPARFGEAERAVVGWRQVAGVEQLVEQPGVGGARFAGRFV